MVFYLLLEKKSNEMISDARSP